MIVKIVESSKVEIEIRDISLKAVDNIVYQYSMNFETAELLNFLYKETNRHPIEIFHNGPYVFEGVNIDRLRTFIHTCLTNIEIIEN
jgi:hypothetical protein